MKGKKVVVTKVAYPAAVTAGLCGGGAVREKGVGGAVPQALAAAAGFF